MLNGPLNTFFSFLGIYGGGPYPILLAPLLVYLYSLYAFLRIDSVEGTVFRASLFFDRAIFIVVNVSGVVGLRINWPRMVRLQAAMRETRDMVGSSMRIHPHTLALIILYTFLNTSMLIDKSLETMEPATRLPEYFHYLVYNNIMVQYTDMVWTFADLFKNINARLDEQLAQIKQTNSVEWLKLIDAHMKLIKTAEELHSCFSFHMFIATFEVFVQTTYIPYQTIRNWMSVSVGSLSSSPVVNIFLLFPSFVYILSLFVPPTVTVSQRNNIKGVLRKYVNKGYQRDKILSAIHIISNDELKFEFYGLINIRMLSFLPMMNAIITNLVILVNYK